MSKSVWLLPDIRYDLPFVGDGNDYKHRIVSGEFERALNVYLPKDLYTPEQWRHVERHVAEWRHSTRTRKHPCSFWNDQITPFKKIPIVWYVHGGAWMIGTRAGSNLHGICTSLAEEGYICVSIGYRKVRAVSTKIQTVLMIAFFLVLLGWLIEPKKNWGRRVVWTQLAILLFIVFLAYSFYVAKAEPYRFPTQTTDISRAIRSTLPWMQAIGGDCENTVLMGHSAGAHLVSTLYASPNFWVNTALPRKNVKCIVLIAGVYSASIMRHKPFEKFLTEEVFGKETNNKKEWDRFFADELLRDNPDINVPPVFLLSAWFDYGLRVHAERLAERLTDRGVSFRWHTLYDTNHFDITCFWQKGGRHERIRNEIAHFLSHSLGYTPSSCQLQLQQ